MNVRTNNTTPRTEKAGESLKVDVRNPLPVLKPSHLKFFYSMLTLWESGREPKITHNFNSKEINQFKKRKAPNGRPILVMNNPPGHPMPMSVSEIRFKTRKNKGRSILSHLRNAFAHNRISYVGNSDVLKIENEYNGKTQMEGLVKFSVLKELVEILVGNLDPIPASEDNKQNTEIQQRIIK